MYDISVTTTIIHKDGSPFWTDTMVWYGVDNEIKVWLADSCKTALFKMISVPEVVDGPSYTLQYQTIVRQNNVVVSDTTLVDFPNLSYETVVDFQEFAIRELKEMLAFMVQKHNAVKVTEKSRSKIKTLFNLIKPKGK